MPATNNGSPATPGSGGGGGGGNTLSAGPGGSGGGGVVVISYVCAIQRGVGGSVSSSGSGPTTRWYHTYTTTGTYSYKA